MCARGCARATARCSTPSRSAPPASRSARRCFEAAARRCTPPGTLVVDRWNGAERVQLRLHDRGASAHRASGLTAHCQSHDRLAQGGPGRANYAIRTSAEIETMSKLNLSVAIGDYDRNRPLIDGAVQIDGVDPVFMKLYPEEIFFRAFRSEDFDICECSLSSFTVKTAAGDCPYVGVPAFVSRMFRHTSIYVPHRPHQEAGGPEGQEGRRAGIPAHRQRLGARDPGGRFRRQADGHALDPRRHRARRTAGEDHHQAAGGRAARQRAGGQDHLRAARRGRDRRLHRAAPAGDARPRTSAGCSAIRSPPRRTTTSAPAFSRSCT